LADGHADKAAPKRLREAVILVGIATIVELAHVERTDLGQRRILVIDIDEFAVLVSEK